MSLQHLITSFDVLEKKSWSPMEDSRKVCDIIKSVERYHQNLVKSYESIESELWIGFEKINHINFITTCIKRETNYHHLKFSDIEKIVEGEYMSASSEMSHDKEHHRIMIKSRNLNQALIFTLQNNNRAVDNEFVREIHRFVGSNIFPNAGEFRKKEAKPAQEEFYYDNPDSIAASLESLFKEYQYIIKQGNLPTLDLIKYAACFLSIFLRIHPFSNGNGRVASILLSRLLLKYTIKPLPLYVERDIYLMSLREAQRFHSLSRHKPEALSRILLDSVERMFSEMHFLMDLE